MATPETAMTEAGPSATPATNGTAAPANGIHGTPPECMSEEEFRAKNNRRFDLIVKKNREGLTTEEYAELEKVEKATRAWVDARHPLPPIDPRILEVLRRYGKIDSELPDKR